MFPAAAVVDPDVLSSLPPKLVAYTGEQSAKMKKMIVDRGIKAQ